MVVHTGEQPGGYVGADNDTDEPGGVLLTCWQVQILMKFLSPLSPGHIFLIFSHS